MSRKKIIAANWKMNKTSTEAKAFMQAFKTELGAFDGAEAVIVPSFVSIATVATEIAGAKNIQVGAQNVYWEKSGAFTAEISTDMLKDLGVTYVVIGHSERRQFFGETNETVNKRIKAALAAGLRPIFCIGETLTEREAGRLVEVITSQVKEGLANITGEEITELVLAYEPVWAIGTGKVATPEQAQEVHALIRKTLAEMYGEKLAGQLRIQYGGSVKAANAKELLHQEDIDGALVGGASLDPREFALIVKAAVK
ncbi:MAG: triose-phosphate isomerase [Verrucomicrobiota bacterium]|nr:triose-phosphate isomerase [Verrucomicrobiota bacterium]